MLCLKERLLLLPTTVFDLCPQTTSTHLPSIQYYR